MWGVYSKIAPIHSRAKTIYLLKITNKLKHLSIFYILEEENVVEVTFEGVTLDEVSLHIGAAYISRISGLNKTRNLLFIRVCLA